MDLAQPLRRLDRLVCSPAAMSALAALLAWLPTCAVDPPTTVDAGADADIDADADADADEPTDGRLDADDAAAADEGPEADADRDETCDPGAPLDLETQAYEGDVIAAYVPVVFEGAAALMHLDTAAGFSILYLPAGTPWTSDAGTVRVGCEDRELDGWGVVDPGFGTVVPVVGSIGGDWVLEAPTLLEVSAGLLTRGAPAPEWSLDDVDHQVVNDTIVVSALVDGAERLLLLDTGAAYTLLDGEPGQPGDVYAPFYDWNGNQVEAYFGSAELDLAGVSGAVPVLRTESFVGVEYAAESTGLPITGLLGLSSVDALYLDPATDRLWIRPLFDD